MYFLVIDDRFGTPIYAFLELDPRGACDAVGLSAWAVTLEFLAAAGPAFACSRKRTPGKFATSSAVSSVEPSLTTRISTGRGGLCRKIADKQFPIRDAPLNVGMMIEMELSSMGTPLACATAAQILRCGLGSHGSRLLNPFLAGPGPEFGPERRRSCHAGCRATGTSTA